MPKFVCSTGSISWIDPWLFHPVKLPEVDWGAKGRYVQSMTVPRSLLVGEKGFRFTNFLEAYIEVEAGRITGKGFSKASRMYRAPSFLDIPSETYKVIQLQPQGSEKSVTFTQLVGCRTQSPELIAESTGEAVGEGVGRRVGSFFGQGDNLGRLGRGVGKKVGREVIEEVICFPPIWTMLSLTIRADGTYTQRLLRHSHFPSNCFYAMDSKDPQSYHRHSYYDAYFKLDHWKRVGWGDYDEKKNIGNPWGIGKPTLFGNNCHDPINPGALSRDGQARGALAQYHGPVRGGARGAGPVGV